MIKTHVWQSRGMLQSVAIVSAMVVMCGVACTDSDGDTDAVTDTVPILPGIAVSEVDNRRIPSTCTPDPSNPNDNPCDDRDPCTMEKCVLGECVYSHSFESLVVARLPVDDPVTDAAIIGERVYAAVNTSPFKVQAFNVRGFEDITLRSSTVAPVRALALDATWGGYVLAAGEVGIAAFAGNEASPEYQAAPDEGVLTQLQNIVNVTLSGNNIWIAGYDDGVTLVKKQDDSLQRVGTAKTIGRAVAVAPRGDSALVADSLGGAVSVYLEDGEPVIGQPVETPGRVVDVDINSRSAIIAEFGAGFSLLDISQMSQPKRLIRVETDAPVVAVRMIGAQTALVFKRNGQVMRVGFLDYTAPRLLETYQLPGQPTRHGVDFYNGFGVITLADHRAMLVHNGCAYE